MAKNVNELEREAKCLSLSEQAQLAQSLIASLDPGEDLDAEEAWLSEAERRYQAYREGTVTARPAAEVFQALHVKLK
jgi:putative addiction module component (TIGR02574 family)